MTAVIVGMSHADRIWRPTYLGAVIGLAGDTIAVTIHPFAISGLAGIDRRRTGYAGCIASRPVIACLRRTCSRQPERDGSGSGEIDRSVHSSRCGHNTRSSDGHSKQNGSTQIGCDGIAPSSILLSCIALGRPDRDRTKRLAIAHDYNLRSTGKRAVHLSVGAFGVRMKLGGSHPHAAIGTCLNLRGWRSDRVWPLGIWKDCGKTDVPYVRYPPLNSDLTTRKTTLRLALSSSLDGSNEPPA